MKTLLVLFLVVAAAVAKPFSSFEDDLNDGYFVRSFNTGWKNAPSFRLGKSFSDVSVEEFDDDDAVPVAVFSRPHPVPVVVSHAVERVPVVSQQKSIDVQTYSAPSAVPVVTHQTYSAVPQVYSGFSPAGSVAVHSPVVPQVYSGFSSAGSVAVHSPVVPQVYSGFIPADSVESQAYSGLSSVGSVAVHAVPSFSVQPASSVAVHAASPSFYSVPTVVSSAGGSNFIERPVSVMTYQQPAFRSAVYTAPDRYVIDHSFEDDRFDFD